MGEFFCGLVGEIRFAGLCVCLLNLEFCLFLLVGWWD